MPEPGKAFSHSAGKPKVLPEKNVSPSHNDRVPTDATDDDDGVTRASAFLMAEATRCGGAERSGKRPTACHCGSVKKMLVACLRNI